MLSKPVPSLVLDGAWRAEAAEAAAKVVDVSKVNTRWGGSEEHELEGRLSDTAAAATLIEQGM